MRVGEEILTSKSGNEKGEKICIKNYNVMKDEWKTGKKRVKNRIR